MDRANSEGRATLSLVCVLVSYFFSSFKERFVLSLSHSTHSLQHPSCLALVSPKTHSLVKDLFFWLEYSRVSPPVGERQCVKEGCDLYTTRKHSNPILQQVFFSVLSPFVPLGSFFYKRTNFREAFLWRRWRRSNNDFRVIRQFNDSSEFLNPANMQVRYLCTTILIP